MELGKESQRCTAVVVNSMMELTSCVPVVAGVAGTACLQIDGLNEEGLRTSDSALTCWSI